MEIIEAFEKNFFQDLTAGDVECWGNWKIKSKQTKLLNMVNEIPHRHFKQIKKNFRWKLWQVLKQIVTPEQS